MSGEVHDECGVAGAAYLRGKGNAVPLLYKMLLNLQNRGQLSAGITSFNSERDALLSTHKEIGSVNEVFATRDPAATKELFDTHAGPQAIGHVRYATFGKADRCYAHPFERKHGRKSRWFSFCFNGNIANYNEIKQSLLADDRYHLVLESDTEIIMHLLAKLLTQHTPEEGLPDLKTIFGELAKELDGAYSLAYMDAEGRLAAIRDPHGIRPLCYGTDGEKILFASESVALENLGLREITTLQPGELLLVKDGKITIERFAEAKQPALCMFEYVYFANVASTIEGRSVYEARMNLGRELARIETLPVDAQDYVVVSVPDSSKPFGEGYAYELGLPHREGLVRNRFVGRTFIEEVGRAEKVKNKFSLVKEVIAGKKVLLLDDSVVRGTTSKKLIDYLRTEGKAQEIHLRVSCPPIVSPCFFGIDMSSPEELIARQFHLRPGTDMSLAAQQEMAEALGADSLLFQPLANMPRAIGRSEDRLCMACLSADYPTDWGEKLYQLATQDAENKEQRSAKREQKITKRAYEG